ncbi:MAG: class I SAM-dependent methyltransferase [Actinomycetota bacterium]
MQTEFEPPTENAALKSAIIDRIQREDGITFRDFMQMALYEPGLGYYCTPRETMGRSGDYLTSPEVSPLFGAMFGRQLREMWGLLGAPSRFDIVEVGAGNGTLCRDVLSWAKRAAPEMLEASQYTIVEPIPALEAKQQAQVDSAGLRSRVHWLAEMPGAVEGCIVSNELLDGMPVHRVAVSGGELHEIYVNWDGARFVEELRDPAHEVRQYFDSVRLLPGEGCRAEVNLAAARWMRDAGSSLSRGFVLTFDYGYEASDLYAPWRADGTLLCFYRHNPSGDPYARIGRQDMTSHVDFTTLRRAGEDSGLTTAGLTSQAEFLTHLGISDALPPPDGEIDLEERLARRRAISELLDPAGLGRIKVLVQAKGVADARLRGFAADA